MVAILPTLEILKNRSFRVACYSQTTRKIDLESVLIPTNPWFVALMCDEPASASSIVKEHPSEATVEPVTSGGTGKCITSQVLVNNVGKVFS